MITGIGSDHGAVAALTAKRAGPPGAIEAAEQAQIREGAGSVRCIMAFDITAAVC